MVKGVAVERRLLAEEAEEYDFGRKGRSDSRDERMSGRRCRRMRVDLRRRAMDEGVGTS